MKTVSPFLIKLAGVFSVVGHPLLTTALFIIYSTYQQLPVRNAAIISGLLIGGVILPVLYQNYQKTKRGLYTNFDVSNQKQRYQFYPILMGLLALVVCLLFATHQPRSFCYGMLFALLLIVSSYVANFFSKVSLHTSISLFIAVLISLINPAAGVGMGIFSLFVAISRLLLKRHTVPEILIGGFIGLAAGAGFYLIMNQ